MTIEDKLCTWALKDDDGVVYLCLYRTLYGGQCNDEVRLKEDWYCGRTIIEVQSQEISREETARKDRVVPISPDDNQKKRTGDTTRKIIYGAGGYVERSE